MSNLGKNNTILGNPKILIIVMANTMVYSDQISGGDRLFIEISKHLDPAKYELKVITTKVGESLWRGSNTGAEVICLPSSFFERMPLLPVVPIIYAIRTIYAFLHTYKVISSSRDRVVLLYSSSDFMPDVFPPFLIKLLKKDIFWISRIYHIIPLHRDVGNFVLNFLSFIGQRISFFLMKKKSDLILCLNPFLYQQLLNLGFSNTNMSISGAGIDIDYIDSIEPEAEKCYDGIFVGRIHPAKGVYDLIEIWKNVVTKKKDAKLAIIGGGDKRIVYSLKRKICESGLQDNVDYLGFISDNQKVYKLLKSSKVFLFADHEAGWSLATCEAMACGLPVVAYNLEIFGTIFKQGFVTVPLYNIKKFSEEILHLLTDDKKRSDLAEEARQQAKSFSWKKVAEGFSNQIESMLKARDLTGSI